MPGAGMSARKAATRNVTPPGRTCPFGWMGILADVQHGFRPYKTDGSYRKYARKNGVPMAVYDNLYRIFDPRGFDAEEWARTFKEAGAGYVVFTTKHHDGFCMFDSQYTDYDIMNGPFARGLA